MNTSDSIGKTSQPCAQCGRHHGSIAGCFGGPTKQEAALQAVADFGQQLEQLENARLIIEKQARRIAELEHANVVALSEIERVNHIALSEFGIGMVDLNVIAKLKGARK